MQRWLLFFLDGYMIPRPRTTSKGSQRGWSGAKAAPFFCSKLFGDFLQIRPKIRPRKMDLPIWRSRHRISRNASSNSSPRTLRRRRWGLERERRRRRRRWGARGGGGGEGRDGGAPVMTEEGEAWCAGVGLLTYGWMERC